MRCVCLEEEKGKKESDKTCQAGIGTSAWKPDKDTLDKFCETDKFPDCPRLRVFMNHALAASTLKVKTS
jgi:hypothetical protein